MFPPIEDAVLQNNPDFAHLYQTLTTAILNPDGSTKNDPSSKEREAVREELKKRREKAARQHLLTHAIATTSPASPAARKPSSRAPEAPEPEIDPAICDLLILLPPLLSPDTPMSTQSLTTLLSNPPFSSLEDHLPQLAQLVSGTLHTWAVDLARLLNPGTNPSYLHRAIPSLPEAVAAKVSQIPPQQRDILAARHRIASETAALLRLHEQAMTLLVRALEAKHGVAARSAELRAKEVALMAGKAERDAAALLGKVRAEVYDDETSAALEAYMRHLKDGQARLAEGSRGRKRELEEYGVGVAGEENKERLLREMAKAYAGMEKEIEEVRSELARLQNA